MTDSQPGNKPYVARPPFETCLKRGLSLRCPRCGETKLFKGLMKMHERCAHCNLKYERDHGYFLGSIYINYGLLVLSSTFIFLIARFGLGIDRLTLVLGLLAYCIVGAVVLHRISRSLWLALDRFFDPTAFEDADDA